jgi:hypothetical protein
MGNVFQGSVVGKGAGSSYNTAPHSKDCYGEIEEQLDQDHDEEQNNDQEQNKNDD